MKNIITTLSFLIILNVPVLKAQKWTRYTTANSGLSDESINKIILTPDGKIWMATYYGVCVFNKTNQWTTYTTANSGLIDNVVFDMAIDSLGNKWFATNAGVSKFDGTNWTSYNTANSELKTTQVFSIGIDKKGKIYFGQADNFISILNGNSWSFLRVTYGNMHYNINTLSVANSGNVYFSIEDNGLFLLANGNIYDFNTLPFRLFDQKVRKIFIDEVNSKVWIGTEYALSLLTQSEMKNYDFIDMNLSTVDIYGIFVDGSNNKWLGTVEGLAKFDGINFTFLNTKNSGIPDNKVGALALDNNGVLWMANKGLTRYNPLATGNEELFGGININVYPNPAEDILHIIYEGGIKGIEIRDCQGRMLINTLKYENGINIESLNQGVYFLTITTERGDITKSFLKN